MLDSLRLTRREFVQGSGTALLGAAGVSAAGLSTPADEPRKAADRPGPDEVLRKLLEGNTRFVRGEAASPRRKPSDFAPLVEGQAPLAVIVGCADSRVAPEILFDQGIGDLFVVRVAGNVVNGAGPTLKGSIEYAVAELAVPLIVVLGHSKCGAVKAAMKHIDSNDALPGAINDLVNNIKPAVLRSRGQAGDALENAVRANVVIGVERLKTLEPILAGPVKAGKVKVVGAVYDLKDGRVKVL
jgi:carbonic anhydrase